MAGVITVAGIDDDRMVLQGLASWVTAGAPDIRLVGTAATVAEHLASGTQADVVLLDLNLRDHTHPAANVKRLIDTGAIVLVFSTFPDTEHIIATIEAGAMGYVTKDRTLDELVQAVRDVVTGEVVTPELAFALSRDSRPTRPQLSEQERRLLIAYASGMTLTAAARKLGVHPGTARVYLARIKQKYLDAGRPTHTKLDLSLRAREDRLE